MCPIVKLCNLVPAEAWWWFWLGGNHKPRRTEWQHHTAGFMTTFLVVL